PHPPPTTTHNTLPLHDALPILTEHCSMNDGPIAFRLGLHGMKATAEASIVERDVQLAQQFAGARLHVAHVSTADALKAVRRGKRERKSTRRNSSHGSISYAVFC